jgi:hypothetical protein
LGRSVDWLTATVPVQVAKGLIAESRVEEPGHGRPGFRESEKRAVMGGIAWRRWEPSQASGDWGTEYESWEFPSEPAIWGASWLRGRECRPSRVDVAWDFVVGQDATPDHLAEHLRPYAEARGFSLGISGQDGRNTRYVGSASSKRRIRIYRKDWQRLMWGDIYGPTIRVELIMRAEIAQAWWQVWDRDQDAGYAAAAGHVLDMSGLQVQEPGPVPELVPVEGADEAAALFEFLDQHGPRLVAWERAGLPVLELARQRVERAGRTTVWRMKRLQHRVGEVGIDAIMAIVRARLAVQRVEK